MKYVVKPTFVLTLIATIIAVLLSCTYNFAGIADLGKTIPQEKLDEYRGLVLPNATKLVPKAASCDDKSFLGLYVDESSKGIAIHFIADGYGGKNTIKMLVGFDENGVIAGSTVIENAETPNLGSKALTPKFLQNFIGKSKDEISVDKNGKGDIDAITGATISSKAISKAFTKAYEFYNTVYVDVKDGKGVTK